MKLLYRVEAFEFNPLKVAVKFLFWKKSSYALLSQNMINSFFLSTLCDSCFFLEARSVTSPRNRLPIHLSNYWRAGISNYVYSTIYVITKIYISLLCFTSVSFNDNAKPTYLDCANSNICNYILPLLKLHCTFCFMN